MTELGGPLWLNRAEPAVLRGTLTSEVPEDRATRPPGGMLSCNAVRTWPFMSITVMVPVIGMSETFNKAHRAS